VSTRDFDLALVLGGGNALGAFEAGVYHALHDHDLMPDWIVGASIGAINGGVIAGNAPPRRIEALRTLWRADGTPADWPVADLPGGSPWAEVARRTAAVGWTLAAGRPGMFGPLLSSLAPWADDHPALFETDRMAAMLARLIDLDELNAGHCRFTATAVDLATGLDVVLDSRDRRIGAEHIRASAALPVAYPAVEIDGRWLVDGGLSANLPLDPVLAAPSTRPMLCVAVDLLPLARPLPRNLGETAARMQDLVFAAQSRRTIARWQAVHAGRDDIAVTLAPVVYTDQELEVAGKALDFSGPTIAKRWAAGRAAGDAVIARLTAGSLPIGRPGLHVVESA
jgi:NTE family protein